MAEVEDEKPCLYGSEILKVCELFMTITMHLMQFRFRIRFTTKYTKYVDGTANRMVCFTSLISTLTGLFE